MRLLPITPLTSLEFNSSRTYNNFMFITFNPIKRDKTLTERGLDFTDAWRVFAGPNLELPDVRKNYGEQRTICFGVLDNRMVVVVYAKRGRYRRIISMRKANEREKSQIAPILGI